MPQPEWQSELDHDSVKDPEVDPEALGASDAIPIRKTQPRRQAKLQRKQQEEEAKATPLEQKRRKKWCSWANSLTRTLATPRCKRVYIWVIIL